MINFHIAENPDKNERAMVEMGKKDSVRVKLDGTTTAVILEVKDGRYTIRKEDTFDLTGFVPKEKLL